LAHGDDEFRGREHADLAEFDLLGGVVVAGGAQYHQLHLVPVAADLAVVGLDLGPHVEGLGVFDGQFVQAEAGARPFELVGAGLEHAQPDESALDVAGGGFLDRNGAHVLAAAVLV